MNETYENLIVQGSSFLRYSPSYPIWRLGLSRSRFSRGKHVSKKIPFVVFLSVEERNNKIVLSGTLGLDMLSTDGKYGNYDCSVVPFSLGFRAPQKSENTACVFIGRYEGSEAMGSELNIL